MLTEKEFQILQLRQKGMLQVEIAKRLHITQGAVSRFEKNARWKIQDAQEDLKRLAEQGFLITTKVRR
jgi:transcriptional regulator